MTTRSLGGGGGGGGRLVAAAAVCGCTLLATQTSCGAPAALEPLAGPVETTADVPAATGWKQTTVISGLEHPWGLAFLPGGGGGKVGDMLITERPGRMRLVRGGELVKEPIKGVPEVLVLGQGGLLDVALHPDFANNQYVYFTYSTGTPEKNHTVLARGTLDDMELSDVQTLFETSPDKPDGQHFGSVLLFLPDGTLLMSVGDGGNPPVEVDGRLARENGQRLDVTLAKVLRLDENGKPPKDNPFVGKEGARPEIYTYGNRNIQGLALDPDSGRVWANEHGPFGGDELNLIEAGQNYGWPVVSYGRDYKTKEPISEKTSMEGMVDPKVVWVPAHAPSGLMFYTGDRFPDWRGSIFSGGLAPQEIRRVALDGENVTGQDKLPIGRRVRDIVQGPDGLIYVLTDHPDGELLRIEPQE